MALEIVNSTTGLPASQVVTRNVSPAYTSAYLTTLLATPPQNLTVGQLQDIVAATRMLAGGSNPAATLGSLFQ